MISAEGETIDLCQFVDPEAPSNKGCVERWLLELQHLHWDTILSLIKASLSQYILEERSRWALMWPAQVVLAVSQIYWTQRQEHLLKQNGTAGLKLGVSEQTEQLSEIVNLVRGKVSKLDRRTICALVTIDVHGKYFTRMK